MGLEVILKKFNKKGIKKEEGQENFLNKRNKQVSNKQASNKQASNNKKEFRIIVKAQEQNFKDEDYLNYEPEIKFSFLPGVFEAPIYFKILAIIFYIFCIIFIIDTNYLVSVVIYIFVLFLNSLRIKKDLKENGVKISNKNKLIAGFFIVLFIVLVVMLSTTHRYKSNLIANTLVNSANYLERNGFHVNKYTFYEIADLLSGEHPLPYYKKGIYLFEKGELAKAQEYIEIAYDSDIVNYQVHYLKGKIAFLNEDHTYARKNFEIAYQKNRRYLPTLHDYAFLLLNQGELEKANNLITEAMNISKNNFEVNKVKGYILMERGEYERSLEYFDKAIAVSPGMAQLYTDKARALIHMSKIYEAEATLERAFNIDRDLAVANFVKGILLYNKNDYKNAIEYLLKATSGFDEADLVQAYLTLCYLKENDFDSFEDEMENLLNYDVTDSEVHYIKSIIYLELYDLEKALYEIKEAIKLNSTRAKYYSLKADIYFEMDEFEKLERANSDAWILDENDIYAYYVRAKYLLYLENFKGAHESFEVVYKRNPFSARAHAGLAYAYNALDERKIAYELMQMSMDLEPNDYYVRYMKALLDFERKRFESSLNSAQRGLEMNPNFYRLNLIRAKAFLMTDRYDEAIKEIEKIPDESRQKYTVFLTEAKVLEDDWDSIQITNTLTRRYPNRYGSYLVRARRFLNVRDFEAAQDAINDALRALDSDGVKYENLSQYETSDTLDIRRDGYKAYLTRYKIINEMGLTNKKARAINDLLYINPYLKDAYYFKGSYLQEIEEFDRAREMYKKALEIESNFHLCQIKNTDIYAKLLEIYRQIGEDQKAEQTKVLLERLMSAGFDL